LRFEKRNDNREVLAPGAINKSRLQRNLYTISLMNEGLRAGLLTSEETARMQNGIMLILQDLIRKHTQGESTSVTTEVAESLLTSLLYATDAYLLGLESPEEAIACLRTIQIYDIHVRGVEAIRLCFEETKRLYKEVIANKLDVPVDAYQMTLEESLPVFLKKYGIVFDAHNTMASIDYPLAIDDMKLQGVFYIKQYLERIKLETGFCATYERQELLNLLASFGRECRFNYRIELFNIFELVLNNAISRLSPAGM